MDCSKTTALHKTYSQIMEDLMLRAYHIDSKTQLNQILLKLVSDVAIDAIWAWWVDS